VTGIRFALPGKWARIPLESEAEALRSVRKLVEQATNRRDDMATLRAELRARFTTVVEKAREGGATEFFVGLELVPGIPLPAWAVVFPVDENRLQLESVSFSDLTRGLDFAVGEAPEGGEREVSDDVDSRIHAVRHAWRRTASAGDGETTFDMFEVDYWLAAANPNRVALVTFSTALAEYEEEMSDLFDAVIGTLVWPAPTEAVSA